MSSITARHRPPVAMLVLILLALAAAPAVGSAQTTQDAAPVFDQKTVLDEAEEFFGEGAKGLADVVEKAFKDYGRPTAYIKGQEVSGAIGIGAFYGEGAVTLASGETAQVYWQGPSVGFDLGAEAAKTFILVYNLYDVDELFKRYPGVSGSLYFVAGVGMNYARRDDTVLAPIRFGVGWRQGASVGYMHFTREKKLLPL